MPCSRSRVACRHLKPRSLRQTNQGRELLGLLAVRRAERLRDLRNRVTGSLSSRQITRIPHQLKSELAHSFVLGKEGPGRTATACTQPPHPAPQRAAPTRGREQQEQPRHCLCRGRPQGRLAVRFSKRRAPKSPATPTAQSSTDSPVSGSHLPEVPGEGCTRDGEVPSPPLGKAGPLGAATARPEQAHNPCRHLQNCKRQAHEDFMTQKLMTGQPATLAQSF